MLPHILHSTTRAAAAVQNQTHTIRNVLHLQSSGPSSGSGPNWGNGPGPGGSKFNAGSRFHAGFNSAGRAVTQANIITTQDGNFFQSDDADESAPRRHVLPTTQKRHRIRSSSVSLSGTGRNERGEKMGVLKTIQLHARSRHVFAPVETLALAKERLLAEAVDFVDVSSRPLLVRRNSTSAPLSPLLDASTPPVPLPTPPPELDQTTQEQPIATLTPPVNEPTSTSTDTTTQTVTPPPAPQGSSTDEYIAKLASCEKEDSAYIVRDTIQKMLQDPIPPNVKHFNAGLRALLRTRRSGEPLNNIIRLYNDMLDASVVPTIETYETLIVALTSRDFEVHHAILSIELRLKNRSLLSRWEFTNNEYTQARLDKLKAEDNFGSAMSLFESVLAINRINGLSKSAFVTLIRSCAYHGNVKAAIHVFAQMERNNKRIDYPVYRYMILAFSNARMINQAEEIFREFLKSQAREKTPSANYLHSNRHEQIKVWNSMIETYFRAGMPEKAIELLERMLASTAGDQFGPMDTPIVTPSTFTAVITGFIDSGDISSALAWFERLLAQKQAVANSFEGLGGAPMRPDSTGWHVMINGLAKDGKIDDLNRLYHVMKSSAVQDRVQLRPINQLIVYSANLENIKHLDDEAAVKILNFILEDITAPSSKIYIPDNFGLIGHLTVQFVQRGQLLTAVELMRTWFTTEYKTRTSPSSRAVEDMQNNLNRMTQEISNSAKNGKGELDFGAASVIVHLHRMADLKISLDFAPWYLHVYGRARFIRTIDHSQLTSYDWNTLLGCAVEVESAALAGAEGLTVVPQYAFNGIASLLEDIAQQGLTFSDLDVELGKRAIELLQAQVGYAGCQEFFSHLGPSYHEAVKALDKLQYSALESALTQESDPIMQITTPQSPIPELPPFMLNPTLSETLDSILRSRGDRSVRERMEEAYILLKDNLMKRQAPEPSVLAYLIEACGRSMDMDKVRELYTVGQSVLQSLSPDLQLDGWVSLENSMIIALGHSGNIDASHVHRLRILDQGRVPSADAYGVLIQHMKDTTDDTSGALALFQEGLERGMRPNIYLYNNIISKLAKARKADYALELFQQMRVYGSTPSSVTYSAVIGACARVGDVQLAQALFTEMTRVKGFKPRVPPYNTMMQLFTTIKPSRADSLYYYNELRKTGVEPSAHTYKLLMDTYGCLEPVDLPAMEKVFQDLQAKPDVELTTGHFSSLINAYGCVAKDFDKAISVFQSIPDYPNAPPMDAIVFEAVINVLVAHRRTDLLPVYVSKMNEAGVHMTAYIANFLIKGYANMGDIDQARSIFESLRDPPSGMAAPHNHVPHGPAVSPDVHVMDVVYREPSTWEVMVRAELGVGNIDGALALLKRIKARQYPDAVYNRISGVMTDHSLPPIEPLPTL